MTAYKEPDRQPHFQLSCPKIHFWSFPLPQNSHRCSSCCTEAWRIQIQSDQTLWSNDPSPAPDLQTHCLTVLGCCCTGLDPGCRTCSSRCRSTPGGRLQLLCWWCCRWDCRWTPRCASLTGSGSLWSQQLHSKWLCYINKDNLLFSTLAFHIRELLLL